MKKNTHLPITVLLAVKNEAKNLPKCLNSLEPAKRVIVVDSQSTDDTVKIARRSKAKVLQFRYKGGYPKKRQWTLNHEKITTPWILLIDADEEVSRKLWGEIALVTQNQDSLAAYLITKEIHFMGKKLRFGGFNFSAILLFKSGKARFEHLIDEPKDALDMEVHERLIVNGAIGTLKTPLVHNDFKDLESYIARHNKYSTWDSKVRRLLLEDPTKLSNPIKANLFGNSQERRRFLKKIAIHMPFEPLLWFIYHYFLKLGFLEGKPGYIASLLRAQYIFQVRAKIYESRLNTR